MIEVTRPKLNRFKYAAMLLVAMAVAGTPLAYPALATAEPNSGVWDIDTYDYCMDAARTDYQKGEITLQDLTARAKGCCEYTGGVWNAAKQDCQAPPGDSQGSRQLPGDVHIPSDIATAPTVTKDPPIRVPSDIATVSTVGQGNELAS